MNAQNVPPPEFDRFSETYQAMLDKSVRLTGETGDYFAELKANYLARLLGDRFRGKVLDFGCGVGLLSRFVVNRLPGCQFHGYDPSPASVGLIPPELKIQGRFTSVEDELDRDYDLVVVANVMHHVDPGQRREVIAGLQKRLGPAGKLAVFEHNPANPLTRRTVRLCPFDEGVVLLPRRELAQYLTGVGLALRRNDYITFFPRWLAWLRPLESRLTWLPAGAQYVMVGQNPP